MILSFDDATNHRLDYLQRLILNAVWDQGVGVDAVRALLAKWLDILSLTATIERVEEEGGVVLVELGLGPEHGGLSMTFYRPKVLRV